MKRTKTRSRICSLLLTVSCLVVIFTGCGGLRPHGDLLVADQDRAQARADSVEVTFMGCNAFLIESGKTRLLVDPFFSRPGMLKVALGRPIASHPGRVESGLEEIPGKVDAVLITHAHYDHLMDVVMVREKTGGELIASATSHKLVGSDAKAVRPGQTLAIGSAKVHVLEAAHDTICGILPFPGDVHDVGQLPPRKASDYVCGQPLAFLIEIGGKSIYLDSGGTTSVMPPDRPGGTDLAILGCALGDSRERLVPALQRLRPKVTFPSHQDNFFRPMSRPFRMNIGTSMREVRREFARSGVGGRLVLMDFFGRIDL